MRSTRCRRSSDEVLADKIFRRFLHGGGELIAIKPIRMGLAVRNVIFMRYNGHVVDGDFLFDVDDWLPVAGLVYPWDCGDRTAAAELFMEQIWFRRHHFQQISIDDRLLEWERLHRKVKSGYVELRRAYIRQLVSKAKVPLTLKKQLKAEGI